MTAIYIILAIVAVVLLVLRSRIRIRIAYSDLEGLVVSARYLFVKLQLLPNVKRLKLKNFTAKRHKRTLEAQRAKKAKKERKKLDAAEAKKNAPPKKKRKLDIKRLVPTLLRIIKRITSKFFSRIHFRINKMKFVIATGDAATTAITYGAVSQSLAYFLEYANTFKNFKTAKDAEISVDVDFLSEKSKADVDISFSLSIGAIFATGIHLAYEYLSNISVFKGKAPDEANKTNDKQSPKKEK